MNKIKYHVAYAYQPNGSDSKPEVMGLGLGIGSETITFTTNNNGITENMLNDIKSYIENKYNLKTVVILNVIKLEK